jgi:hypothetical protein
VPEHGIDAVLEACTATLTGGVVSAEVVLNILARRREPPRPVSISPPPALVIKVPLPDCASYDRLRPSVLAATTEADDAAA